VDWLVVSIVASVILTIVLNVALRVFPGASDRAARRMETWAAPEPDAPDRRVKVFFPWKAMLIGSLVLTLLVNVVARLG
jgi:hypothetical protein